MAAVLVAASAAFSPALAHAQDEVLEPEFVVDWRVTGDTGTEFHVAATIRNRTNSTYQQWTIEAPFRHAITHIDGAVSVQDESNVTISGTQPLLPGAKHLIELSATSVGPVSRIPSTCSVANTECRVVVPGDVLPDKDTEEAQGADSPSDASSGSGSSNAPGTPAAPSTPSEDQRPDGPPAKPSSEPTDGTPPSDENSPTTNDSPTAAPGETTRELPEVGPSSESGRGLDQAVESLPPDSQRVVIAVRTTSDWGTGQSVSVTVRHDGPKAVSEWSVTIPWRIEIESMWNAESTSGGGVVRASSTTWNGQLNPGQAVEFGFNASPGSSVFLDGACSAATNLGSAQCSLLQ